MQPFDQSRTVKVPSRRPDNSQSIGSVQAGVEGIIPGNKVERNSNGAWFVRADRWWYRGTTGMGWNSVNTGLIGFRMGEDQRLDLYIPLGFEPQDSKLSSSKSYLAIANVYEATLSGTYRLLASADSPQVTTPGG